jgi:hypothetical protein
MELLKKYLRSFILICFSTISMYGVIRCAHPVAPTGGPKDIVPPAVTATTPPNYSVNFNGSKIIIEFDEFIQLKDQAKEIFTSPPMVKKPEMTIRGKSLIVELKEELRENLTYVINFGSAIVDIAESNPLRGYTYVFSTGPAIDSLVIGGKILNAFDLTPVENVLFAVYLPDQDTIPPDSLFYQVPPISAVRTSSDGSFQLTNLPGGTFMVYGLEDLNNNFYYDLPTEKIAFLDSLVTPEYIENVADTLETDTIPGINIIPSGSTKHPITLYLFEEFDSTQRILSSSMLPDGSMQFAFRLPVQDFEILPVNFPEETDWMLKEYNPAQDTLIVWPKNAERDTFDLILILGDTLRDTVTLIRKDEDIGGLFRRKATAEKKLQIKINLSSGVLPPGKPVEMIFSEPLATYDFTGIMLYATEDTIQPEVRIADSIGKKAILSYNWNYGETYSLYIPDSVISGISGASNDSVRIRIDTKPLDEYGSLIMNYIISPDDPPYIAELINEKGIVVKRDTLVTETKVNYLYLNPGSYRIKTIIDKNRNGKWDTGSLLTKTLPEPVIYFTKDLTVRANWELQEEWQPGQ